MGLILAIRRSYKYFIPSWSYFVPSSTGAGMIRTLVKVFEGAAVGAVLGIPISYFFQPGLVRAFLSLGEYMSKFQSIWSSNDMGGTAHGTVLFGGILGAIGGAMLAARRRTTSETKVIEN
jgi:hypothetical protein